MITVKFVVVLWFGLSVAAHIFSQIGLWLWLASHSGKVAFLFIGIPGYIEKRYRDWAVTFGRSPDLVVNFRCASWINLVVASAAFIAMMQMSQGTRLPNVSQAELDSHFMKGGGPDWLYVPGGHRNFDATTADLIAQWLVAHDTDWEPAHLSDFGHGKPQLLIGDSAVEIDSDRIRASFDRNEKDSDSTIYIQRRLSPSERSFWDTVIGQIKSPIHDIPHTEPAA